MNTKTANIPEVKADTRPDDFADAPVAESKQAWPFNMSTSTDKLRSAAKSPAFEAPYGEGESQEAIANMYKGTLDVTDEAQLSADAVVEELQGAAPTPAEVHAPLNSFNSDPITLDELKALGYEDGNTDVQDDKLRGLIPQDWAESLTGLNIALRDLTDSISGKDKAKTEDAMRRLKHNQHQLGKFLRMRGLSV